MSLKFVRQKIEKKGFVARQPKISKQLDQEPNITVTGHIIIGLRKYILPGINCQVNIAEICLKNMTEKEKAISHFRENKGVASRSHNHLG